MRLVATVLFLREPNWLSGLSELKWVSFQSIRYVRAHIDTVGVMCTTAQAWGRRDFCGGSCPLASVATYLGSK